MEATLVIVFVVAVLVILLMRPRRVSSIEKLQRKLAIAQAANYRTDRVLKKEEATIFEALKTELDSRFPPPGFPIFAQVPLGAFIESKHYDEERRKQEWRAITSFRPDIIITTYNFRPIVAIEYDGGGHNMRGRTKTELADAIKATALSKAGIPLVRILPTDAREEYIDKVFGAIERYRSSSWR